MARAIDRVARVETLDFAGLPEVALLGAEWTARRIAEHLATPALRDNPGQTSRLTRVPTRGGFVPGPAPSHGSGSSEGQVDGADLTGDGLLDLVMPACGAEGDEAQAGAVSVVPGTAP